MRKITKKAPPTLFQQYTKAEFASYDDMDLAVKVALKEALFEEQHGVCAYCQQKLKLETMTIEHHCERSICNGENGTEDRTLDYSNLLAVCPGKGGQPTDLHCDTKKAQFKATNGLPINVSPLIDAHVLTIKYSVSGLISSSNKTYNDEIHRILNLNTAYLKDMRKSKWGFFFKYSLDKNGKVNKEKMKRLLENELSLRNNLFANNFPGLCEYLLDKYC